MSDWEYPKVQNLVESPNQKVLLEDYWIMGHFAPKGFIFDLGSVPGLAKWYVDDDDRIAAAATIHDYLYVTQSCTRREADQIFYEILLYTGFRKSQAWLCWLAVRAGGWVPWKRRKTLRQP